MEWGGRAGWVVEGGYQPQLSRLFAASNLMNIISAPPLDNVLNQSAHLSG